MPGYLTHLGYTGCREVLRRRLAEPSPGRIQLVTGPRQVGKTTLLLELAAELGSRMAAYPGAMELRNDMPRWTAYVRDAIVEPAIGRDILALAAVRRPALLRQVFAVAAASPAQIVSLQKLQGQLQDRGALETIAHYLHLLEEAYVVAPLEKH